MLNFSISETKLQKEHDMACNRLKDWKRRFGANLDVCNKEVSNYKILELFNVVSLQAVHQ